MPDGERVFWHCHSCGAQMRPIRVDGVRKCASCQGEFIEILDPDVNPDPRNELPPPPPTRPHVTSPPSPQTRLPSRGSSHDRPNSPFPDLPQHTNPYEGFAGGGGVPGMIGGLLSGFFGGPSNSDPEHAYHQAHPSDHQHDPRAGDTGAGLSHRTYQFNIGNGRAHVTIGQFGQGGIGVGGTGMFGPPTPPTRRRESGEQHPLRPPPGQRAGVVGFGPFGPLGGQGQGQRADQTLGEGNHPFPWETNGTPGGHHHPGDSDHGGLDAFFPGFPPMPPNTGGQAAHRRINPDGTMQPPGDIFRTLMSIFGEEGIMELPRGNSNFGDYVTTEHGFNDILETLMQAAGPQGPLPATDAVIEGLPRSTLDEKSIEKSQYKDCPICKDDFAPGDEIMTIPCEHIYHVDCIQPWLRRNGSCAVCRFSLVPADDNRSRPNQARTQANGNNTSASEPQAPGQEGTAQGQAPAVASAFGPITNILQRLWGQGGAVPPPAQESESTGPRTQDADSGGPTSQRVYDPPTSPPPASATRTSGEAAQRIYDPPTSPPPTSAPVNLSSPAPTPSAASGPGSGSGSGVVPAGQETLPNSIPEDYRARHRQREQEQHQQQQQQQRDHDPYVDDLD